jgi:hypothetical protein
MELSSISCVASNPASLRHGDPLQFAGKNSACLRLLATATPVFDFESSFSTTADEQANEKEVCQQARHVSTMKNCLTSG